MTTSDQINELAAALSKAQGEMGDALKTSDNPSFGSKYADLSSVWEACRAPLAKHEIAIVQSPSTDGAKVSVDTFVIHRSGQWMHGTLSVSAQEDSPQAVGSAISYLRHYALQSFAGVAPADDDAEAAHGRMNGKAESPRTSAPGVYTEIAHPPGYLEWLDQLRETAMLGTDALHQAWRMSQLRYTLHLKKVGGDLWPTLKDIAARKAS